MAKFLDLTGLGSFKERLQAWADGKFALKGDIKTKTSQLTNDSDFQTGTQVDTKINAKVASVYKYKGTKSTYAELPTTGQVVGDVWNIEAADTSKGVKAGDNVVWVGTNGGENKDGWDNMGGKVDLSNYVTKEAGKGLSEENFTSAFKTKLEGLKNYVHAKHTAHELGLYKVNVDAEGHVSSATPVVKKDITDLGIPAQDTTYSDMTGATASAAGKHGLVPAPKAGDQEKYLAGDGTYKDVPQPTAITEAEISALFS